MNDSCQSKLVVDTSQLSILADFKSKLIVYFYNLVIDWWGELQIDNKLS